MMKPKILLINPPFMRLLGSHFNNLSLGICYIASVLRDSGYEVKVYNADYKPTSEYVNIKDIYNNYGNYNQILNNIGHPIWQEIKFEILKYNPNIVGISMLTGTYKSSENIARLVKEINPNILTICGGPHPTINPKEVLSSAYFDVAVRGEGEQTFLELINGKYIGDINGLSFCDRVLSTIHNNPDRGYIHDLDSLPFPARDLFLNDTKYMNYGYIITGRGCPFRCSFCASEKLWGRTVRFRSPEDVLAEVIDVYDTYNTHFFYFLDDTLTLNKRRVNEICKGLLRYNDIEWICNARVGTVDEETVRMMKKSGCTRLKVGIESGNDNILKNHKGISKQQIREFIKLTKEIGIDVTGYFMIGYPEETDETVKETINFAQELDLAFISPSILAPSIGTKVYDDILKSGISLPINHSEYFFHQSKDMIRNIDPELVDKFMSLVECGSTRF